MPTNFVPVNQPINVEHVGAANVMKAPLPTTPRSIQQGSPLWTNGASGVEPALMQAGDSTSVDHANGVFGPLFLGFAAGRRVPQQLLAVNQYAAGGATTAYTEDASKPFISVYTNGIATAPCAALQAAHEIGEYVQLAGFVNEASVGFYAPDGSLVKDTNYYLYNDQVQISTTQDATHSIGKLVERAVVGQTFLRFEFEGKVTY